MTRQNRDRLMFDEDEIKATTEHLPRLVRILFYGLGITNDGYVDRYRRAYTSLFPLNTRKEFNQKCTADRKFLQERRKLTFNMLQWITMVMGYDILSVSINIRDKLTGEIKTFSTDDTVESLKKDIAKEKDGSIQSLMG